MFNKVNPDHTQVPLDRHDIIIDKVLDINNHHFYEVSIGTIIS